MLLCPAPPRFSEALSEEPAHCAQVRRPPLLSISSRRSSRPRGRSTDVLGLVELLGGIALVVVLVVALVEVWVGPDGPDDAMSSAAAPAPAPATALAPAVVPTASPAPRGDQDAALPVRGLPPPAAPPRREMPEPVSSSSTLEGASHKTDGPTHPTARTSAPTSIESIERALRLRLAELADAAGLSVAEVLPDSSLTAAALASDGHDTPEVQALFLAYREGLEHVAEVQRLSAQTAGGSRAAGRPGPGAGGKPSRGGDVEHH